MVVLPTPAAVKVAGLESWTHHSRVKPWTSEHRDKDPPTSSEDNPTDSCEPVEDLWFLFKKNKRVIHYKGNLYVRLPIRWTIIQATLALKCTFLTPEVINATLGRPLTLTCWSNCSTPVDPNMEKRRHTICPQRVMRSFCLLI